MIFVRPSAGSRTRSTKPSRSRSDAASPPDRFMSRSLGKVAEPGPPSSMLRTHSRAPAAVREAELSQAREELVSDGV